MAGFDVEAARKAGYSDDEILSHLTETRKFDVEGARKSGYSNADIIGHLSSATPASAKPSRKDSLKGGPSDMPAQGQNPTVERGFWGSVGDAVAAPFNLAANLDTVTPGQIVEGLGSPFMKYLSGNPAGAAGDLVGGAITGKVMGGPSQAPELAAAKRTAIMDRFGVADAPKAQAAPAQPSAVPGIVRKVVEKVAGRHPAVKTGLLAIDLAKAVREVLGEQEAPAAPAEAVAEAPAQALPVRPGMRIEDAMRPTGPAGALSDAPGAAQIPQNATQAQLATFSPQMVMDYLSEKAKPALATPETPAEAAAMPTKRTRAPKKAEAAPEVQTIPAPPSKYTSEQFSTPARAAKAGKLADLLHEHGITFEEASGMLPEHWKALSEAAGVKVPSAESIKVTLSELQRLSRTSDVLAKNPKAQKIAQELADSMMQ